MSTIKRSIYLGYYLKKLDLKEFKRYLNHASNESNTSKSKLVMDAVNSVYKYNIGLMDYFIFKFYNKRPEDREKWVGTGYKYEFDLKSNPKETREILQDKLAFYDAYQPFIKHLYCTIEDLEEKNERASKVFNNKSGKIVVKDSLGQCGWGVEVLRAEDYNLDSLLSYMKNKGLNMAEEFILQHDEINKLSPSGVNTIRMITIINKEGGVDFLGARMRVTVNSYVDNLASGNVACSIDLKTGKIDGDGVFKDITKVSPISHHPVTKTQFKGFQIPMWDDVLKLTKEIAAYHPENRAVGWDVVLTDNGPDFLEGNHNWCEILWQLPINQGLKQVLEGYW